MASSAASKSALKIEIIELPPPWLPPKQDKILRLKICQDQITAKPFQIYPIPDLKYCDGQPFRKVLDSAAFKVYGHWVKKIPCQNRAAMFELAPKRVPDKKEKTEFDMEIS